MNRLLSYLIVLLAITSYANLSGQNIQGKVTITEGTALEGVNVVLFESNDSTESKKYDDGWKGKLSFFGHLCFYFEHKSNKIRKNRVLKYFNFNSFPSPSVRDRRILGTKRMWNTHISKEQSLAFIFNKTWRISFTSFRIVIINNQYRGLSHINIPFRLPNFTFRLLFSRFLL